MNNHGTLTLTKQFCCFAICFVSVLNSGCAWLRNAFYRGETPPTVFASDVTKEQIIQKVNANSKAIQSMQAKVHVRATGTPTLSGDLSVEQPSRMRMQVGLLNMTSSGIDIGSNDEEFWVWLKTPLPGQPPAVMFAKHTEYENSAAKKMLPIEPAWVIDSLGLAYFDPRAEHTGPFQRPDGTLEIQSRYQTSAGPMIKSTMVDPRTSSVVAQEINKNGVKIASSVARKHQYFKDIDASIPREVEIEVGTNTPQPGKVVIELSNIIPNSIDETYAGMWEMPRPSNINMIDIAKQMPSIPSANAAGGPTQFNQPRFAGGSNNLNPNNPNTANFGNPSAGNPQTTNPYSANPYAANANPASRYNELQANSYQANSPQQRAFQPTAPMIPANQPNYKTESNTLQNPYTRPIQNASYNADEDPRQSIRGFGLNRSN